MECILKPKKASETLKTAQDDAISDEKVLSLARAYLKETKKVSI